MKKTLLLILLALSSVSIAVTVTDVTTPGRSVGGNIVSDADEDPEVPIFGNVFGSGSHTISWAQVSTDENGDPVNIVTYEIRYKESAETEYTVVSIPSAYAGYATTLSAGSYSGFIEAVDDSGWISSPENFSFTIN